MDQEGDGKEVDVADLKRVLTLYGNLEEKEIQHFFSVNLENNQQKLVEVLKRITKPDDHTEIRNLIGSELLTVSDSKLEAAEEVKGGEDLDPLANVKSMSIDKSVNIMFNHLPSSGAN